VGKTPASNDDQFSDEEAARRRDEVVKRMLNTPPQPRKQDSGKADKAKKKPAK
jgi:hypothetical protein